MSTLPIRQVEGDILRHLQRRTRLVLTAPTGSGKTTQVPQILLHGLSLEGQILVLQPRRLATRLVARRVAEEMGVPLGQLVGYQTRHDSRVSRQTRIRFLTEGLFLRQLQSSLELDGVAAVLLDEFHERSVNAEISLGLVRRLQAGPRPDLRIVIMSATLDATQIADALDCPTIEAQGRTFPVNIEYRPGPAEKPPWDRAAEALRDLLEAHAEGDVLVFMPGAYEIRRTIQAAQARLDRFPEPLAFFPLHGGLPARQQDAAVSPCDGRKIIVATNVAETSITIEGVRHVVDAGLARVQRHDPRRGLDALLVEPISRAAAEQRAGRAGRTAPGTCVRLWSAPEQQARPERDVPEVRRVDLAQAVLHLRSLAVEDLSAFPWLEEPDAQALGRARDLLASLDAIDEEGRLLTETGQAMAFLPLHPRLGRLLVEASRRGCLRRAALWAALIGERDILVHPVHERYTHPPEADVPSDLVVRERAFHRARELRFNPAGCAAQGIHANLANQVERTARLYLDSAASAGLTNDARDASQKTAAGDGRTEDLLKCLLVAFYDHVALRRDPDNLLCAMAGQRRVELDPRSVVRHVTRVHTPSAEGPAQARSDGGSCARVNAGAGGAPDGRTAREGAGAPGGGAGRDRAAGGTTAHDRTGRDGAARANTARDSTDQIRSDRQAADGDPRPAATLALVALEMRELEARGNSGVRTVLSLASAIDPRWLEEVHPRRIGADTETTWNAEDQAVEQARVRHYDGLVYEREPLARIESAAAEALLVEHIRAADIKLEQWDTEVEQWIRRTRLVARLFPERGLILYDEEDVGVILHEIVAGATRASHLRRRPCLPHLRQALSWPDQQFVEEMAPTRRQLPSGAHLKIEYPEEGPPRGRAKIQELYGLAKTPTIAGGRQRLLLEILGPNFRPVQVTDDLAGFWSNTYPEVKKELKRRYPKHEWR